MKFMKKFFIAVAIVIAFKSLSFGALYDLNTLKQKENSIAKDYYIHKLLEKSQITKAEAQTLHGHIWRYQGKIKKAIELLAPRKVSVGANARCFNYTTSTILNADSFCAAYRVNYSLYFVSKLTPQTRTKLAAKLTDKDAAFVLRAFNAQNTMKYIVDNNNTALFFKAWEFFEKPDMNLPKSYANALSQRKEFRLFARNIIIQHTHPNLRKSFLNIDAKGVSGESAFNLGINALVLKNDAKALLYFTSAYQSFEKGYDKDNALFWMYQITKKKDYLQTLSQSKSLNIYSIYAMELENVPITQFSYIEAADKDHEFDIGDPFLWQSLAKEIQNADKAKLNAMAQDFNATKTLPIHAYILERVHNFRNNYFIMPYFQHLADYDTKRKALILAIGRQESRFIPTAISTSYALGMMQFMPFVANNIAQNELKLPNFEQDDMFKPEVAYFFANHHLGYLEEKLGSPVLIAYAYNGGITFTNRQLDRGLFKPGKYEPFLSMERVSYTESRIYAKRVLANYIVYLKLLNDEVKISSIFEDLIQKDAENNATARKDF